jgi:LysR family glycine cleavage system transcriptional activator
MPRHEGLQTHLGAQTEIRVVASEYEQQDIAHDDSVDLRLTFLNPLPPGVEGEVLFEEEVFPVCAPGFAEAHADAFAHGDMQAMARLPLLHLSKRNFGWASWEGWMRHHDVRGANSGAERRYSSYVYLLEAASDGAGLALGWRGLCERYLEQGRLVRPVEQSLRPGGAFRAVPTQRREARALVDEVLENLRGG